MADRSASVRRVSGSVPAGLSAHFRQTASRDPKSELPDEENREKPANRECGEFLGPLNPCSDLPELKRAFGTQFLIGLFFIQHLCKGLGYSLISVSYNFLMKKYNTPAPDIQIYKAFVDLPWGLKPIWGMMSDTFPVGGYRKLPYMTLASLSGLGGLAVLAFSEIPKMPVLGAVFALFAALTAISVNDLLTESKYAEKIRTNQIPTSGPLLVAYVWTGVFVMAAIGTIIQGPIIQNYGPQLMYGLAMIPIGLTLVPIAMNYVEDTRLDGDEVVANRAKILAQPELVGLTALILVACICVAVVNLAGFSKHTNALVALCVTVVVISSFLVFTDPVIGKVNAFAVLQSTLAVSIDGASFYFFTDDSKQFPGGPNFTIFFFTTGLGLVVQFANLIGIGLYSKFMKDWSYRSLYFFANFLVCSAHLWGALIFSRTSRDVLGIPDNTFAVTSSAMESITKMWMWMPSCLLCAHLSPPGSEAIMYAMLAGCANLGDSCAQMLGAFLLEYWGVMPTGAVGDETQFTNLWRVALFAAALPFCTMLIIPLCIPDVLQTEAWSHDWVNEATAGSFYNRWRGREARATEGTPLAPLNPPTAAG